MGNVAIAFIQHSIVLSEGFKSKRRIRLERERIRSLIPRYIARLNDGDETVTTLDLEGLGVDSRILRLLSGPLIGGGTRVRELYLQSNWIGPEGATCIARILSRGKHLRHVSLAHNPVGNVGVMAIASALEQNSSLEKLDLSHCDIDDDGIRKLARSLRLNSRLEYCYLGGNHASSVGVASLLRCVYDTASMQNLWGSNHTLRAFYAQRSGPFSSSFPESIAFNRQLVRQLGEVLAACNRRYAAPSSSSSSSSGHWSRPSSVDPLTTNSGRYRARAKIAACKILRHYLREKMFEYYECVESMEERLVPNVIRWLVNYGDLGVIYGVVRDMPWLVEKKVDRDGNLVLVDENKSMSDATAGEIGGNGG